MWSGSVRGQGKPRPAVPHASHANTPLVRVMSEPEREDQSPSDARWGYRPSLPPVPQGGGGRAPRDPIKPPPSPGTVPAGEGPHSKGGMGAGAGLPTKLATRASVATRCWRSRLAPATRQRTPVLPSDWRINSPQLRVRDGAPYLTRHTPLRRARGADFFRNSPPGVRRARSREDRGRRQHSA